MRSATNRASLCMNAARSACRKLVLMLCVLALCVGANADDHQIITFDPPGSILTLAMAINAAGTITGVYLDANNVGHGFLRAPDGTFTQIDVPGAGTRAGQGTQAESINPTGATAGFWVDASYAVHGFLRTPSGIIAKFDVPGAGTGASQGTYAYNINPAGEIGGVYLDENSVFHGFLRAPDGNITTFDVPGRAGTGAGQGTDTATVDALNAEGALAGAYVDEGDILNGTQVFHGYVRAANGNIIKFDVPGAGSGPGQGTNDSGINDLGVIPGYYVDSSGSESRLRAWSVRQYQ